LSQFSAEIKQHSRAKVEVFGGFLKGNREKKAFEDPWIK
jgi:hypothetical protein